MRHAGIALVCHTEWRRESRLGERHCGGVGVLWRGPDSMLCHVPWIGHPRADSGSPASGSTPAVAE